MSRNITVFLNKVGTVLLWLGLATMLFSLSCYGLGCASTAGKGTIGPPSGYFFMDLGELGLITGIPVVIVGFLVRAIFRED